MENYISAQMRAIWNIMIRSVEARERKNNCENINESNRRIIGYIYKNKDTDIFATDIEKEFSITRSTVSKVLDTMETKNLIKRESGTMYGRKKKITLTEKSLKMAENIGKSISEYEDIMMKGFSKKERDEILSYLKRMKANLLEIK